jgi:hypothetical protein
MVELRTAGSRKAKMRFRQTAKTTAPTCSYSSPPEADRSLLDHVAMEEKLAGILGCKVDLVSQRVVERRSNWIRRKAIPESAEPYFASR